MLHSEESYLGYGSKEYLPLSLGLHGHGGSRAVNGRPAADKIDDQLHHHSLCLFISTFCSCHQAIHAD
jgi:hypothetical protein